MGQLWFGLWNDAQNHTQIAPYLCAAQYPWDILDDLNDIIHAIGKTLPDDE